jgi:tetratricopeptide (TPR) repeat protein
MGSIFVNLALAYERMGQFEKARLALEQVANRGSRQEPLAHLGLASLAIQRGDFDAAAPALAAARAAWGGSAPPALWYHYAGLLATVRGDTNGAVEVLSEGVSRYPSSAVLLNNLAVAQEILGDFDRARQTIDRAVQTDSPMPQLYRNLGDILKHAGRSEEAQAAYSRATNAAGITR